MFLVRSVNLKKVCWCYIHDQHTQWEMQRIDRHKSPAHKVSVDIKYATVLVAQTASRHLQPLPLVFHWHRTEVITINIHSTPGIKCIFRTRFWLYHDSSLDPKLKSYCTIAHYLLIKSFKNAQLLTKGRNNTYLVCWNLVIAVTYCKNTWWRWENIWNIV